MSETSEELELFHYGVKGMKWGVRKKDDSTPKKSRGEKRAERRETKAQKLDARAAAFQTKIKDLESNPSTNRFAARSKRKKVEKYAKKERQALKDAEAKRSGKLTRNEKIAVASAAIVATYAAYKLGSNYIQSGEANRAMMKGKAFMEGKEAPTFNRNETFAHKGFDADQLKVFVANGINEPGSFGGKVNCRRCTLTYEMRRRGYDVKATKTTTGRGQDGGGLFNTMTKEGDKLVAPGLSGIFARAGSEQINKARGKTDETPFTDFATKIAEQGGAGLNKIHTNSNDRSVNSKSVFDTLSKEPNGSRGEVGITWAMGGGHSIAYEIVNNKPVIFDTQTGKYFKTPEEFDVYGSKVNTASFTRLDNVDLNEDFLMRWMKNA